MSDLISVKSAVEALAELVPYAIDDDVTRAYMDGLTDACDLICQLPSAQPYTEDEIQKIQDLEQAQFDKMYELGMQSAQPESIHCKDCKWKQGSECVRFADVRPFPDDFCSRAERREE